MARASAQRTSGDIAEIQGLYGSFTFPERLLQKIWLRREFDHRAARTTDGRPVTIINPGKWNLLGGPDFRLVRIRIGETEVVGDVELHLRAPDWDAHQHAGNPAYANVVLHVVLFWPDAGHVTRRGDGEAIPTVALLPLLHHDLEEYAADEAVETLSNRPAARLAAELAAVPAGEIVALLRRHAADRWRRKVHFARLRVQRLGWDDACHQSALEVLGFRYNRTPMLRVAGRWPLAAWAQGLVAVDDALRSEVDSWSVQGIRPANHPRSRLQQYAAWTAQRPDWPSRLAAWGDSLTPVNVAAETRVLRRILAFAAVREKIADHVCADTVGGTRMDNLIGDAFLPLLAARGGRIDPYGWWFHGFAGDLPAFVAAGLRHLGVCDGRAQPVCLGLAQGLLGWMIEREVRR